MTELITIDTAFCPSCGSPQLSYDAVAYITGYSPATGRPVMSYDTKCDLASCTACGELFSFPHQGLIVFEPGSDTEAYAFVSDDTFMPNCYMVYQLLCVYTGKDIVTFHSPKRLAELEVNEITERLMLLLHSRNEQDVLAAKNGLLAMARSATTAKVESI